MTGAAPDLSAIRKVLVFRIDKVGDLLLSTPLLRNIRTALPDARVTLVVTPYNAPVLDGWDGIDELLVYDPSWRSGKRLEFLMDLRHRRYDLSLVLSPTTKAHLLGWLSKAATRAGILYSRRVFLRALAPLLLTHPVVYHIDEAVERGGEIPHEVEQMLQLGLAVGLPGVPYPLEAPVRPQDEEWAGSEVERNCTGEPLVGLHLSPKWLSAGWTGENMAELLTDILEALAGSSLLVTWGAADRDAVMEYIEAMGEKHPSHDKVHIAGNLTFGHWAALFRRCRAIVTTDTGSLHLAAAMGRPVVAVYEKATFYHCSRQWSPWKVPGRMIEKNEFSRSRVEIVAALKELLPR